MTKNGTGLTIVNSNGKYGIRRNSPRNSDKEFVLPQEYDNISEVIDMFLLTKDGKIGLAKTVSEDDKCSIDIVVPCENDVFHFAGNILLFQSKKGMRYYNVTLDKLSGFYKWAVSLQGLNVIQAQTKDTFYAIDKMTDEIIYQQAYSYKEDHIHLAELGKARDGSTVLCNDFNEMLYKGETGYEYLDGYFVMDWITGRNNRNILNVIEGKGSIGLVDGNGNFLSDIHFDTAQVDIRIALTKGNESTEVVVPYKMFRPWFNIINE